jgi:ribosomal subunit interface protein
MELKIQTHHVELGEEREAYLRQKFEKLTQFACRVGDESSEIRVEFEHEEARKTDDKYVCRLTLFVPQDTLRAESRGATLESAVDEVIEKVKSQIEHYKSKTHHMTERKDS